MEEAINAIDEAYRLYGANDFQMPTRMQINEDKNTLILMPCITNKAIGTKLVTSFPDNKSLPTLHGLVILNSIETGEIQAILDGAFLTGFRTGAIGGSAIRHLANSNAKKIAIIGTGVQGLYQAIAACTVRPITDIYLYNRSNEKIDSFIQSFCSWIDSPPTFHRTKTADEAIQDAEIIITATTSSTPVLPNDTSLLKNKLVIGIGSFQPTMREFPEALYHISDHIFVDSKDAILESGDMKTPLEHNWINENAIETMSSYLTNKYSINHEAQKSIIFKSTGIALFDVVVGNFIYQNAKRREIGMLLD